MAEPSERNLEWVSRRHQNYGVWSLEQLARLIDAAEARDRESAGAEPSERNLERAESFTSNADMQRAIATALDEAERRAVADLLAWAKRCAAEADIVQPGGGRPLSESDDLRYIIEFMANMHHDSERRGAERTLETIDEWIKHARRGCTDFETPLSVLEGLRGALRAGGGT